MNVKDIDRVYSTMVIKAVDEEKREITGIASTPGTDRMGDIVEPQGAQFNLPIPLLWQHDHGQPIGQVLSAKVTEAGIEIRAKLAKVEAPSQLAARLNEAWESIKAGLVRGLSIGFKPLEYSFLEEGDGVRFTKWQWFELSAVTVPANAEATITTVKHYDNKRSAASGHVRPVVKINQPGDSGNTSNLESKMNLQEQIKAAEHKLVDIKAQMDELLKKSVESGETLDAEDDEKYEGLKAEFDTVTKHINRLREHAELDVSTAKPVTKTAGQSNGGAAAARSGQPIQVTKNYAGKGLALAQVVKCIGRAQGNYLGALQLAQSAGESLDPRVKNVLKAAVAAGSTSNSTWAGALVGDETSVYADFIEYLRPQTIVGRFGQDGIPALREVPFDTPLIGQTSGGAGYWVGEGKAKPLTKFDFSRTRLSRMKVANIAVVTEEVLRNSSPSADAIIRDQLVAALRERLDIDFVDPAKTVAADVSPASITHGVTPIPSTGGDAEAIRADIRAVFAAFIAANNAPTNGVWIMSSTTALALSLMTNPLGQPEFPGVHMNGGTLQGLPVIASEYVEGDIVVLVNASDIYLGDEGGFAVDMSREASLEMADNPTHNSTTPTAAQLVSLWQTNSVGFRAEREVNWAKRRASAVAVLGDVAWGVPAAPGTGG